MANLKGKSEPQMITAKSKSELEKLKVLEDQECVLYAGPFRVRPGGLSVSRTFGDIEAKKEFLGGKRGVVIADPEISSHTIEQDDDFVLLASDGIFDTMTNQEIVDTVWNTLRHHKATCLNPNKEYERILGECVSNVMKRALIQNSEDNITVMMVCFKNLLEFV